MESRHFSRLCRSCQAPMARQEETCWRCGADWIYSDGQRQSALRVIAGGASADRPRGITHVASQTELDADRRADEGERLGAGATAASASVAAGM
jgi:hypothetical protein